MEDGLGAYSVMCIWLQWYEASPSHHIIKFFEFQWYIVVDFRYWFSLLSRWAAIALTTILIRGATLPFLINQLKANYKLNVSLCALRYMSYHPLFFLLLVCISWSFSSLWNCMICADFKVLWLCILVYHSTNFCGKNPSMILEKKLSVLFC